MNDIINNNTPNYNIPQQSIAPKPILIDLNMINIKSFMGWATFNAIINIITGALFCLGIVTAAYGVPQILAGVRLLNCIDELKHYMASNNTERVTAVFYNLHKYFKLSGISIIIKLSFILLGIIFYAVMIAIFVSFIPDLMQMIPEGNYYNSY